MVTCIGLQIFLTLATLLIASYSLAQYHQYPSGSLACKIYNKTKLDCSNRDLVEVPTLDQNLTKSLNLSTNRIEEITGAPFQQLQLLLRLHLSHNEIANLSETAFRGLYSLRYLYLDYNKLTDLPKDVFVDLSNLFRLNLDSNHFTVIPNEAVSSVRSLQELSIYDERAGTFQITEINLTGFQNLSNLKSMALGAMSLQTDITSNTFQPLSSLPLQTFFFDWMWTSFFKYTLDGEIFAPLVNVTELFTNYDALPSSESVPPLLNHLELWPSAISIYTMAIVKNTTFQHLQKLNSSLTHLSFSGFYWLTQIHDYSFIWIPDLITLDLSHNKISQLAAHAFYGLRSLEKLLLQENKLTEVPSKALEVFRQYSILQYLDLSANSLNRIPQTALSAVGSSLKYLNIEHNNNMQMIAAVTYLPFIPKLKNIFIKVKGFESHSLEITQTRQHFSLQTFQLQVTKTDILLAIPSICYAFPNLKVAIIPDIKYFPIYPSNLEFNKCSHLLHLDLSGSVKITASLSLDNLNITISTLNILKMKRNLVTSIKQIFFIKAPLLATLDLSHNLIKSVAADIAMAYPNLESLYVDDNGLESIAGLEGLSFLQSLSAIQNQITSIPSWFESKASTSLFMELDLSSNPFQCTCDTEHFRKWILLDTNTWLKPGPYVCAGPEALKGVSITGIELDCRSKTPMYLGVGFAIGILLCTIMMTLFKYRWHIKYKLVLLYRNYQPIPDNIEEDFLELNLRYHAYVAYNDESAEDTAWVMNDLQPNMEEDPEPLRLFIKSRDAIAGHSIIESIDENIQQSRKTILVLSPNFVDSNWCHHEMEMAKMRFFNDNLNVLILVLLDDIPEQKVPLLLRQLLCKKKYLKWPKDRAGQQLFWRRLRLEIKGPIHADLCFEL